MILDDFNPLEGKRLQVLDADGSTDPALLPELDDDTLRLLFRQMLATRLADRRCVALQREGRMGIYAPVEGQEACQVGSVLALAESDWVVPSFRKLSALLVLPVSIPVGSHTRVALGDLKGGPSPSATTRRSAVYGGFR